MVRQINLYRNSLVVLFSMSFALNSMASQTGSLSEATDVEAPADALDESLVSQSADRFPASQNADSNATAPKDSANATSSSSEVVHKRKATLNFEDELVEGSTQKPELFYLFQKKNFNYKRLIKLREHFLPEMRKTAEDIQRVRGAN